MKYAHIYNLKVVWSTGRMWNLDILATNTEAVSTWLPAKEDPNTPIHIKSVGIVLVTINAKRVDDDFCAKVIKDYNEGTDHQSSE